MRQRKIAVGLLALAAIVIAAFALALFYAVTPALVPCAAHSSGM